MNVKDNCQDRQTHDDDQIPCTKRQRITSEAPDPTVSSEDQGSSSLKVRLGVPSIGELTLGGVKACTNRDLKAGPVKVNPNRSEIETARSRIKLQGCMTDYFGEGINTWTPNGLVSTNLNTKLESPEEEVSTVVKDIDTLKLVDSIVDQ